jgi:heavy metal sensor kinase
MKQSWSIRWRLTVWYVMALSVILLISGSLLSALMSRQLHQRIDRELAEEAKELSEEMRSLSSVDEIKTRFNQHFAEHGGFSFQVTDIKGKVICGSPWLRPHQLLNPGMLSDNRADSVHDIPISSFGTHRVYIRPIQGPGQPLLIVVLVPYAQIQKEFQEFLQILLASGAAALATACLCGLVVARHALQPIEKITSLAERISTENLGISIAIDNPADELGRLSTTLNKTFDRLNKSVGQIKRFTADAAHELRTPLAVLRTKLEVALRTSEDVEEIRDACRIATEQAEKLTVLIDQLLALSRQDAGIGVSTADDVYIRPILQDVIDNLGVSAAEKHINILADDIPDCVVRGDDISISRVFFNLVDNAIKFTPGGGTVKVWGHHDDGKLRVIIEDNGIGIAAVHLPHIFDRFYRVGSSQNGQFEGTGLGLAICRSIVECHHGHISVSSTPGEGTAFTVELPTIDDGALNEVSLSPQYA